MPESLTRLRIYALIPAVLALIFAIKYSLAYVAGTVDYALDFQLYYGAAQAFAQGQWAAVYDTLAIQNYVNGVVPHFHPFINPPWALPLLWPVQILPQQYALVMWYLIGAALLFSALSTIRRRIHAPSWGMTLMLASPHIAVGFASAQAGWIISGLLILALMNHERLPLWAGLALAIAGAIKPHMVIVFLPLFLGLGQWRILASAAVWGMLILIASILILPHEIWHNYLTHMQIASEVLKAEAYDYGRMSLLATKIWGLTHTQAMIAHIILAFGIMGLIFTQARKYGASLRLYSMAAVGVFLVSPYGYMYDAPILMLPLLYWWHSAQQRMFTELERLAFILISTLPVVLISAQTLGILVGPITLILALGVLTRQFPTPAQA